MRVEIVKADCGLLVVRLGGSLWISGDWSWLVGTWILGYSSLFCACTKFCGEMRERE